MSGTEDRRGLFGMRLAENRRLCGYTQEELAGRLGVTPQALSKWERGSSFPDLLMLAEISEQLGISADYLLGNNGGRSAEDGVWQAQSEVGRKLRHSLEPLQLILGVGLVPLFMDQSFVQDVAAKRQALAAEGILMPVVRVQDQLRLNSMEFMILAYDNVLYHEELGDAGEGKLEYIMEKLEEVVRNRYDEILSVDIVKQLTDNLQVEYPALITGIVPEKISYGLLTDVLKELVRRGDSLRYLPRVIERLDHEIREDNGTQENGGRICAPELAERVAAWLERPDNLYVFLHDRGRT